MQVHEEVQINHEDVINEFAEQTHQSEIEQASLAQPIDLLEVCSDISLNLLEIALLFIHNFGFRYSLYFYYPHNLANILLLPTVL